MSDINSIFIQIILVYVVVLKYPTVWQSKQLWDQPLHDTTLRIPTVCLPELTVDPTRLMQALVLDDTEKCNCETR